MDVFLYDNQTETWACHFRQLGDPLNQHLESPYKGPSVNQAFKMLGQFVTKNVLINGDNWRYAFKLADLDMIFNTLDPEKKGNSWTVTINYG